MIQMGQVPDMDGDGQPDDPNQVIAQLQQQMEQAAVAPQPYEDYETHVNVLRRFMTSVEYEALDPQTQQRFVDRFGAMYDALWSLKSMQLEPPKVAYQIKGTAGPTVVTKILGRAGIQTTPDEVSEPPLDTWVTDDVTQPAAQETGNTHLDDAAKAQAIAQNQDEHALKMAKAAHEVRLASTRADHAQTQHAHDASSTALEQSRQEQMHAEKVRQMRQPTPVPNRG
jgi:hypothetical protein